MKRLWMFCAALVFVFCFAAPPMTAYAAADVSPAVTGDAEASPEVSNPGMFDTTAQLGKTFMDGIWRLFDIYVPGFSFTFGQMWLGVALCSISLLVIKLLFGIGGSHGDTPRTGSTNHPKISKERRNDEF